MRFPHLIGFSWASADTFRRSLGAWLIRIRSGFEFVYHDQGPTNGSFNGLHRESNFLGASQSKGGVGLLFTNEIGVISGTP